jgi:hypothetical protein
MARKTPAKPKPKKVVVDETPPIAAVTPPLGGDALPVGAVKRSITVTPAPVTLNVVLLCKQLAAVKAVVDPADVSVGAGGLTLLYTSDVAPATIEPTIRTVVSAHAPPALETDAQRLARLAREVSKGELPNDLSALGSSYMSWLGVTKLYTWCNVILSALQAKGLLTPEVLAQLPTLTPYKTFKEAREAHDNLVAQIAAGAFKPEG